MNPTPFTPGFRLVVVVVISALCAPAVASGFGGVNRPAPAPALIDLSNPLARRMLESRINYLEAFMTATKGQQEGKTVSGKVPAKNAETPTMPTEGPEQSGRHGSGGGSYSTPDGGTSGPRAGVKGATEDPTSILPEISPTGVQGRAADEKKSYSAVKNLPDADELRKTRAAAPKAPAPIPSKSCLTATLDCPSDRIGSEGRLAAIESPPYAASILEPMPRTGGIGKVFFERLLAVNRPDEAAPHARHQGSTYGPIRAAGEMFSTSFGGFTEFVSVGSPQPVAPSGGNGKGYDFDGDGKADFGVWRPETGTWLVLNSSNGAVTTLANFGNASLGDQIVSANYDGDSKADYAYWRPSTGVWTIKQSSNGQTVTHTLGQTGDRPVPADYDGDGKVDIAVWRPSNGNWYYRKSSNGTFDGVQWGARGTCP